MNVKLWLSLLLTGVWFVAAASCSGKGDDGANSPEAVAEALTKAVDSGSYGDLLPLIAPRDRDLIVGAIYFSVAFTSRSKEDLAALKQKYKLDSNRKLRLGGSNSEMRKAATEWLGDIDRNAFLVDCLEIMATRGDMRIPTGKLTDLKLEGGKAEGRMGGKPVLFAREGGRWYMTLPTK